jgi:hypothetical protein
LETNIDESVAARTQGSFAGEARKRCVQVGGRKRFDAEIAVWKEAAIGNLRLIDAGDRDDVPIRCARRCRRICLRPGCAVSSRH